MDKEKLINKLIKEGYLKSKEVIEAMKEIPREIFVSENEKNDAYLDIPLYIGYGQTISAPHMVAIILENLKLKEDSKILEIGTGTGYNAAVVSRIAKKGIVYTVERIKELADTARENFKKLGLENIKVICRDGSLGLPEYSPYTHIYVTCSAPSIRQELIDQLAKKGRMIIPVGKVYGELWLVKKNDRIVKKNLGGCAFVPMVGKGGYDEY
ncbi:MAG: protein-L-isoaspartate(D-aspartate) O-methyltransferase [Thermoplasmatales archaeon]|nr:protein-L-isoaspartate(D-aspartate) O-methyltransferase [Thermoplasmatales archaeon]